MRYPVTPQHPPPGVAVWVSWDGRAPFLAARVPDPRPQRRGHSCWLTYEPAADPSRSGAVGGQTRTGRPVTLPLLERTARDPSRPWAGWHTLRGDEPDAWWPQQPERWAAPLPAPLPAGPLATAGRMWSERTRFQAVADAEAADLAREMEADRAAARSGEGFVEGEAEPPEKQWWLDPHLVTYSAPGAITPREAEGRLMRAFLTERWIRVERPADATFGKILGRLARPLPGHEIATDDPRPVLPEPTGRDQDDMLTALAWWMAVDVADRRAGIVLAMRAEMPAKSWRGIAQAALRVRAGASPVGGRSHHVAQRLHAWALGELTREANGEITPGGVRVRARLKRVQAGNRAARLVQDRNGEGETA